MAHRAPRKHLSLRNLGLCPIRIGDDPDLPGRNRYSFRTGDVGTAAPKEDVRAEFQHLTAYIHRLQETHDRSWLEGNVEYLYVPRDRRVRQERLAGITMHIEERRAKTSLDAYDAAILRLFETCRPWLHRGERQPAKVIHSVLRSVYGQPFEDLFSEAKVRRALTKANAREDLVVREHRRLRRLGTQSAQNTRAQTA